MLLKSIGDSKEKASEFLENHPNTNSLSRINNGNDLFLEAIFDNMGSYNDFYEQLKFNNIKANDVFFVLEEIKKEDFLTTDSHLEMFKKWGIFKTIWFTILQFFIDDYRRKVERGADLLVIKKGYGKELYLSRKKFQAKIPTEVKGYMKKYYLSLNEIKKFTNKLK